MSVNIVDLEAWKEYAKTVQKEQSVILHVGAMNFISTCKAVEGYMTAPVATHKKVTVVANSKKCEDLHEIKRFLDTSETPIFPYQLLYVPTVVCFKTIDPITAQSHDIVDEEGNPSFCEHKSMWIFRYGEYPEVDITSMQLH
jgi:hypothetical protein